MVIYFSARIMRARSSGGHVGYFLGLARALARNPQLSIHAGLTPPNFHEIGSSLPGNVTRHDLAGVGNTLWAANERRTIEQIQPDWVVYSYPDTLDIYDDGRAFQVATCIPDLQHLTYPYFFEPTERLRRDVAFGTAMGSADLILTVSKFSQKDLARTYGCEEQPIKVVYSACAPRFLGGRASPAEIDRGKQKFELPSRYAIFPSNFWLHKNHTTLVKALRRLRQRGVAVPLVLVGDDSMADKALTRELERAKGEGWLWVLGYVTDEEVHALVSGASCLLFPSLFEGFGIPVAEALAVGVPVACSNVCSLPEVGGDVALYFDPEDVESVAHTVEEIWENGHKDATLLLNGQARSQRFNYLDSAAELLARLRETPTRRTAPKLYAVAVVEPPLVSIITPSYQQGRFLRQCIESVLTQNYPHIEYFVLDGGSTDESLEILTGYNGRFFWKSERDGGQTNAINAGLKLAKGSIIAYLNSDDLLLPGAVSTIIEEWRRRPSVDLFYGRANYIDEYGQITGEYDTRAEFQLEEFKNHCTICQPAAFWCRRIMDRIGLFDENFQTAMDYEYWQRIAANKGLIVRIDKLLACSREYPATKTKSQRDKVYKDIFKGQWRHWGRVHPEWWEGFLDYSKNERRALWSALIPASKIYDLSVFLSRSLRSRRR
jgi:glycosyltransferase involved in cell wall biosynthesis